MEASSFEGLNHGEVSLVSRWTNECKWPGRAGNGRPRKGGMIIDAVEPGGLQGWKPYSHQSWPNKDNIDLTTTTLQTGGPIVGQGISRGRKRRVVRCFGKVEFFGFLEIYMQQVD